MLVFTRKTIRKVPKSGGKGYFAGGYAGAPSNKVDSISFTTEICSPLVAVLTKARYGVAGLSSSANAYVGCGEEAGGVKSNRIDVINFSTDSYTGSAVTPAQARLGAAGLSSISTSRGYFCGGYNGSSGLSEIDGIVFSTEAAHNTSAALVQNKNYSSGLETDLAGYTVGGFNPTSLTIIEKLTFATESNTSITSKLNVARGYSAGVNSKTTGYVGGSDIQAIEGFEFSTDTTKLISAVIPGGRSHLAGCSYKL